MPAFQLRLKRHTGLNAFDDEVALEFGDCRDDDDNCAAQRAAPVSRFSLNETNSMPSRLSSPSTSEVTNATRQPVRSPHQHHIELGPASSGHHGIECRATGFGAADGIAVLVDATVKPRCSAMRRRSRNWVTVVWSEVETRV